MIKSIFLILMTMIANSLSGQDLAGRWLLKEVYSGKGQNGYPGFQMLDIKDTNAEFFMDFSLERKVSNLKIEKGEILTAENVMFAKFKIVDENHLILFIDGKSNDKDVVFECNFFRMMPTITMLNKEEIENMTFLITHNGRESKLTFNKEMWDDETRNLFNESEGEIRVIEQIDATLFISIYSNGKRHSSFPIKEVTSEYIILFPIPNKTADMIGYRID